jgi:histidyl-tRNA synthetase
MSKKEPGRPKARLPRGFSDARADEIRARDAMLGAIRTVYERYGFEPLETPAFEFTEALGKFLPDVDRPEGGVFSLQDEDESWLSLRYDLTAPLARFVAENFAQLPKPFRRYQVGPVWRNEKPGPGRFRQFHQFDADTVGTASPTADAELVMMLADTLETLGLGGGQYIVKVNTRKLLDGVLESVGIGMEDRARRGIILRAIDKMDRLGVDGVRALLGPGRKDESGDFTKGAELGTKEIDQILPFVAPSADGGASEERLAHIAEIVGNSEIGAAGVEEMRGIFAAVRAGGYGDDRVAFDSGVVRGLDYYTGAVFEAQVTFPVLNEQGEAVVFGSVAGGGRYDDLVARFTGQKVPATGVSIGVSRLMAALKSVRNERAEEAYGPVVVLVMDRSHIADMQTMTQELRRAGVSAEMYLGESGMRAQLKYADRRRAPIAVIEGADEREKGEVTLKDLILGEEMARTIEDNKTWREDQPAQQSVKRGDLVAAVRAMLERQRARLG